MVGQDTYSSIGTATGVYNVLTNTAPKGTCREGTTVYEYLATLPAATRIVFTGHSLGGALSPAIPMGLMQAGLLSNITPPTNVMILPSAGATPGDQAFSTGPMYTNFLSEVKCGNLDYQVLNTDFYNQLDIVPQAWCTNAELSPERNILNILEIYKELDPNVFEMLKKGVEYVRHTVQYNTLSILTGSRCDRR